ncbi:M81 family metallopeptidase [Paenibacillus foliorum]|uniref:M81 family metallopeptidase n=1 Tax=Paenibacillus foliorum TaxID=2654974 RepID=UPI0028A711AB|nr:M81 family metallopeptidase [Paenibacillus foliorum]
MTGTQLRIAVAGIVHETNTFAPGLTELDRFQSEWSEGVEAFSRRYVGTRTTMGGVLAAAEKEGVLLEPGLYTAATPSGIVSASTADALLQALIASVDKTADGLLLIMHGAMVSAQYPDYEGECLRGLRAKLGDGFPIVMTLDLHGNISPDMVRKADLIVGYDTYPHIDMYERAVEALELLVRKVRGEIQPAAAYGHTGMLVVPQGMMTEQGSMKELMEQAFVIEADPRVLNVTVSGGFPYSDVPDAGMSFIVTTDGDSQLAGYYVEELVKLALKRKQSFDVAYVSPKKAVEEAQAWPDGPVILAEGSDNVGGGAPADATFVLAELVGAKQTALAVICDPAAVKAAYKAGVGGDFAEMTGGKTDSLHGDPVALRGVVRLLFDGHYRHVGPYMTGQQAEMGKSAVIQCGLLTVILTEKRVPPWDLGHVRSVGLWPADFKIILAKSAVAWQAAFAPFAKHVVNVDSQGCCSANLNHFQYCNVKRPVYPLDTEPQPRLGL